MRENPEKRLLCQVLCIGTVLAYIAFYYLAFRLPEPSHQVIRVELFAALIGLTFLNIRQGMLKEMPGMLPALLLALWMCIADCLNLGFRMSIRSADGTLKACVMLLAVLPMGWIFRDIRKQTLLTVLSVTAIAVFGLMMGAGTVAYFTRKTVELPALQWTFGASNVGYLSILGYHHYLTAFIAVACFFAGIWLMTSIRKKWVTALLIPFEILFLAVTLLSTSRNCLAATVGTGLVTVFLLMRLKTGRRGIGLIAAGLVLCASTVLFLTLYGRLTAVTEDLGSQAAGNKAVVRAPFEYMGTLTGRTPLYKAVFPAFRDHPEKLLTGFGPKAYMKVINSYTGQRPMSHMHNGHLEILMISGLPAFLLSLWLTLDLLREIRRSASGKTDRTLPERTLCLIPLALLITNLLDRVVLFADIFESDALFFLFSGYLLCLSGTGKPAARIPFFTPDVGEEEIGEVAADIRSGWLTTGPRVKEFEQALAGFLGTGKVICLSSQTACMEMTLRILGIGPGDEVITSAYTYTATAEVIARVGARIVLVDTQKDSTEMDYDALEAAVTECTKAIIPVDIGGVPCDYERILRIAERKKELFRPSGEMQRIFGRVIILADAAHALGAMRYGKSVGSIADITAFSMHAVKNLTTAEGGAVVWRSHEGVDPEEIYHRYHVMSLHGQSKDALDKSMTDSWEYDVLELGYKCNMTDLAAALGLSQIRRYSGMLAKRQKIIRHYDEALCPRGVWTLAHTGPDYVSSGHLYLTRIPGIGETERNEIIHEMGLRGIDCNVHYKPLPLLTAYRKLGFDIRDYPNAYDLYRNEITLPLYTRLTEADTDRVIDAYLEVIAKYL